MKNQLIKDLPLYLNGFSVTYLFIQNEINIVNMIMFFLSVISFFWYGKNQKSKQK
jgi:hypothetical protein